MNLAEEHAKSEIAKVMQGLLPRQRREMYTRLSRELIDLNLKIVSDKRRLEIHQGVQEWLKRPIALGQNDHTRFHKLADACREGRLHCIGENGEETTLAEANVLGEYFKHIFVVKHDWAGAFEDAVGVSDEWKLPYDLCAFEFVISGHPVIVVAMSEEVAKDDPNSRACAFIEINGLWGTLGSLSKTCPPLLFAWQQIRAVCIALDAEVAISTVERAPLKLNEKRERSGKTPIRDFNIVDLSRRHRVIGPGTQAGTKKRLHFRRGHWRHFQAHRTWIKWMLVGNPDLGFVAKNYSL